MPGPLIATIVRGLIGRQAARGAVQSGARQTAQQAGRQRAAGTVAEAKKPEAPSLFRAVSGGAKEAAAPAKSVPTAAQAPAAEKSGLSRVMSGLERFLGLQTPEGGRGATAGEQPAAPPAPAPVIKPEAPARPPQAAEGKKPEAPKITQFITAEKGQPEAPAPQPRGKEPQAAPERPQPARAPSRPTRPTPQPSPAEPSGLSRVVGGLERFLGLQTPEQDSDAGARQPEAAAAAAKKPEIDYGRLVSMMGQPGAKQELQAEAAERQQQEEIAQQKAKQAADEAEARSRTLGGRLAQLTDNVIETASGMVRFLGTVTGLTDAKEALASLIKMDFTNAAKSGTRALVKMSLIVVTLPIAIKKWSDSLVESRRELIRYNSRIAAAIARLDYQQFRLNVRGAAATQTSTVRLTEAVAEFREAFQPLSEDMRTVVNTLATGLVRLGTLTLFAGNIAAKMSPLLQLVDKLIDKLEKEGLIDKPDEIGLQAVLDTMKNTRGGQPPPDPLPPLF